MFSILSIFRGFFILKLTNDKWCFFSGSYLGLKLILSVYFGFIVYKFSSKFFIKFLKNFWFLNQIFIISSLTNLIIPRFNIHKIVLFFNRVISIEFILISKIYYFLRNLNFLYLFEILFFKGRFFLLFLIFYVIILYL